MPKRALRSLKIISLVVFLVGVCVVLGGLNGQTHVWRGGFLASLFLSGTINGLTGMALGIWLWGYCRAVRDRGEPIWLAFTLAIFVFLNGAALLLGSLTPFLPRRLAMGVLVLAIFIRVVSAGFAAWNFPRLRRSLKEEGKRPTRAEQQAIIDDLRGAKAALAPAPVPHDHDLIRDARVLIDSALARANALFADMEARATQE